MAKRKRIKATPKPVEATWSSARLYRADLYDVRWPVCGTRLVWAVVGYKWVRLCTPITNVKWRMKRSEWDATPTIAR